MAVAYSKGECIDILQNLDEEQLTKQILIPLLRSLGFEGVRYEHGRFERGKDLVFWRSDAFGEKEWYAAQVKVGKSPAGATDANSLRALINQLQQACDCPFVNPDGDEVSISRCLFITSAVVSTEAREAVKGLLRQYRVLRPVKIIDAPELVSLIRKYCPSLLIPWEERICPPTARYWRNHSARISTTGPLV